MKIKLILIGGMLLAGCAGIPIRTGTETMTVTLQRAYDAESLCSAISGKKAVACACVKNKHCTIILNPYHTDEVWGHELRHCFDGTLHPEAEIK